MQRAAIRLALTAGLTACGSHDATSAAFGGPTGATRTSVVTTGGEADSEQDSAAPTIDTTGAPITTDMTGTTGTTGTTGDCVPGASKPGVGACSPDCTCSPAGAWVCPPELGCDTTGATSTAADPSPSGADESTSDATTGGALQLPMCSDLTPSDPFVLNKASVDDDTLGINVGYPGGCVKHGFELCFIKLKDDVLLLDVDHDAMADACDGYSNDERQLDLTPLRFYSSPVKFSLPGWPSVLEYTY